MSERRFVPESVLDREEERAAFAEALETTTELRVITLCDKTQTGKSALLELLRWLCTERDPRVPACLIALDQLKQPHTPYEFVETVQRTLTLEDLEFPQFRKVEDQRLERGMAGVQVNVEVKEMRDNAQFTALSARDINVGAGNLDRLLQDRAVEAFVRDLREDHAARTIVLLIDAYEQCGEELATWLRKFLRGDVLHAEAPLRNVVVVIAGQDVPLPELRKMLAERFEQLVRPFPALSPWNPDTVRALIDMKGVKASDADVDYFHQKLCDDFPVGVAIQMLDLYPLREGE